MDRIKEPFSGLKKSIKRRIKGKKGRADSPGAGGSVERIGPSGPPPQPGPAVATGGGPEQEGNEPNTDEERVEPSAAPDENKPDRGSTVSAPDKNKPDWRSTVSASAKLLLRGVRDSADAFGPLKSVAGGLCFILENCEVWSPFRQCYPQRSSVLQRTEANRQVIESLLSRVEALAERLCEPVPEDDIKERERRQRLEL